MPIKKPAFYTFGIPIKGKKNLTNTIQITNIAEPNEVAISLSQHIGQPSTLIVKVGDYVKKGQLIAKASSKVSANIFASVSGTIIDIKDLKVSGGLTQTHVIIKNSFTDEFEYLPNMPDFSKESIIKRIEEAGIVGLGGAGFPTSIKVQPTTTIDTLVVNGAECEPYLTCDHRLMLERKYKLLKGIELLKIALGITNVYIGIEVNKPDVIDLYKDEDLFVVPLKKLYPGGSEKHLIYATTKRKVPPQKMPFDVGVVVQNVKTILAIYDACYENEPLIKTVITVSGKGINTPKNLIVPIGTSTSYIIDYCGGQKNDVVKVICGGPMMGKAINNEVFTKKTDCGLLLLTKEEASLNAPTNCIRCGRCIKACPMNLEPVFIEFYTLAKDYETAKKYGTLNCIECGACSYVCPAKRPLVQSIQFSKQMLREAKK